jgi:hypothetical protein
VNVVADAVLVEELVELLVVDPVGPFDLAVQVRRPRADVNMPSGRECACSRQWRLLVGLAWTWIRPASARAAGLAAQGFALVGTLVGIFTIAVGVGPRTAPDASTTSALSPCWRPA